MMLLALVGLAGSLFAGGFALSGVGSKAQSMGGNFRGLADDPTSIYWNPAGLGFMANSYLTSAGTGIIPSNKFEYTGTNPGWIKSEVDAEKKTYLFPNLYGVWASESKIKFGLGLFVPNGLGATWDAFELPTSMVVDTLGNTVNLSWAAGFPEEDLKSSVQVIDVHPTAAYQITDCLSLGMGVSLLYGDVTIVKLMPHKADPPANPDDPPAPSYGYNMPTVFKMEGNGYGYGANFGLLYKKDKLGIGISGKLPTKIDLEGDANIDLYVNNVISKGLTDLASFTNSTVISPIGAFNVSAKTKGKAELRLPGDIGLGLKYNITEDWLITGDVVYTTWSEFKQVDIKMDTVALTYSATSVDTVDYVILHKEVGDRSLYTKWDDTFRFGFGTEYKMNALALRAGFYYDDTPIPDETMTPTFPDISEKYSTNFGLGYDWNNWLFEANYQNIIFPERVVATQTDDNNQGIYNNLVHAFNLGITYKF